MNLKRLKGPIIFLTLYLIIFMFFGLFLKVVQAAEVNFDLTAKSALLMEFETGDILYQKEPHLELPPASMTKIMTMLLVMEALDKGEAKLNDLIVVSERAASMGGSQIWLEPGEEMSLEMMMKAIAIVSANDCSVAVAEYLYGSEEAFVARMNEKAQELGLKNTSYYNTNGLPPDDPETKGTYTSAYDLALVAREILKYPKVLEWTSTWIDYLRNGESVLNNTNKLVRHYKGADGLKTGFTQEARYGLTSTAKRNGIRFIAVVMGVDNSNIRFNEAAQLLSHGFAVYRSLVIAQKGEVIEDVTISNAKEELAQAIVLQELIVPVKKGEEDKITKTVILDENIRAPLNKGDKIGEIRVLKGNLLLKTADIVVDRDVQKASIFQLIYRLLRQLIRGIVNIFTW